MKKLTAFLLASTCAFTITNSSFGMEKSSNLKKKLEKKLSREDLSWIDKEKDQEKLDEIYQALSVHIAIRSKKDVIVFCRTTATDPYQQTLSVDKIINIAEQSNNTLIIYQTRSKKMADTEPNNK